MLNLMDHFCLQTIPGRNWWTLVLLLMPVTVQQATSSYAPPFWWKRGTGERTEILLNVPARRWLFRQTPHDSVFRYMLGFNGTLTTNTALQMSLRHCFLSALKLLQSLQFQQAIFTDLLIQLSCHYICLIAIVSCLHQELSNEFVLRSCL